MFAYFPVFVCWCFDFWYGWEYEINDLNEYFSWGINERDLWKCDGDDNSDTSGWTKEDENSETLTSWFYSL